jgi:hypothetical protein
MHPAVGRASPVEGNPPCRGSGHWHWVGPYRRPARLCASADQLTLLEFANGAAHAHGLNGPARAVAPGCCARVSRVRDCLHRQLMPRLDRAVERPHNQVRKDVDQRKHLIRRAFRLRGRPMLAAGSGLLLKLASLAFTSNMLSSVLPSAISRIGALARSARSPPDRPVRASGDPGTIEVIASLEDELMTVFAARLAAVLNRAPLVNATRHWPLRARRDQFRAPPDIP